jgi:hypothetical protein
MGCSRSNIVVICGLHKVSQASGKFNGFWIQGSEFWIFILAFDIWEKLFVK